MPIYLYRLDLGRLLGHRFLLLVHRGRKSGLLRETVLEVILSKLDQRARRLLEADVQERPALTLEERCRFLKQMVGVSVSESTLSRLLRKMGFSPTVGQIVVMDNLSSHRGHRVRELIEARGCELMYLPPYSPDLNPIEEAFSKLKALLRRAGARTRKALLEAMGGALDAVSASDAWGFFEHRGYRPLAQPL